MLNYFIIFISLLFLTNCDTSETKNTHGSTTVQCGSNKATLEWQVTRAKNSNNRFALLLSGSPVVSYFSDIGSYYAELKNKLNDKGYDVFEFRYPRSFYEICGLQGIENIKHHSSEIYNLASEKLGFDSRNLNHKIVGVGWSIGAIKLQAMSFMDGNRIDNIALTGILLGDVAQGCKSFVKRKNDGYSWKAFHDLAMMVTKNFQGCYGTPDKPSEYTEQLNFERQPYYSKWKLGLFEGEAIKDRGLIPGNLAQAKYIKRKREEVGAPVTFHSYPNCGHELINCTKGKAVDDIINFIEQ